MSKEKGESQDEYICWFLTNKNLFSLQKNHSKLRSSKHGNETLTNKKKKKKKEDGS